MAQNFQPQVRDTTNGPYEHTYIPRSDDPNLAFSQQQAQFGTFEYQQLAAMSGNGFVQYVPAANAAQIPVVPAMVQTAPQQTVQLTPMTYPHYSPVAYPFYYSGSLSVQESNFKFPSNH